MATSDSPKTIPAVQLLLMTQKNLAVPAPPTFTTSTTTSSITASITDDGGATSFEISTDDGATWTAGLTKTGLTADTTYQVRVRGTNSNGTGNPSDAVPTTTDAAAGVTILEQADFTGGVVPSNWSIFTSASGSLDFSGGFARGTIPATDSPSTRGTHVNISIPIPAGNFDLYIRFRARMPFAKGGCKFCKVSGLDVGGNYANTTFGTDYSTGDYLEISYGNGEGIINDANVALQYAGNVNGTMRGDGLQNWSAPQGRTFTSTDWGTDWHNFKIHCKFNSGTTEENQVADGEYYVEIDGVVWGHATGIYNRHWTNENIEKIVLYNWSQDAPNQFTVDFDDIVISTGGFA